MAQTSRAYFSPSAHRWTHCNRPELSRSRSLTVSLRFAPQQSRGKIQPQPPYTVVSILRLIVLWISLVISIPAGLAQTPPPPPALTTSVVQAGGALYAWQASGSLWVNSGTWTAGTELRAGSPAVQSGSLYLTGTSSVCVPSISLGTSTGAPFTRACLPPTGVLFLCLSRSVVNYVLHARSPTTHVTRDQVLRPPLPPAFWRSVGLGLHCKPDRAQRSLRRHDAIPGHFVHVREHAVCCTFCCAYEAASGQLRGRLCYVAPP